MVIQHNLPAMNSHRQLSINNSQTSKNLEKLSSGYKVNRAADDAAGLAISEKMRGQIRGLAMATQNAENGISLIRTAEGGLNETHAILQRMRELAVQSSNGTYHDEVDRENIAKEMQALKGEVDRIAASTNYNGIKLLDGTMGGSMAKNVAATGDAKGAKDGSEAAIAEKFIELGFNGLVTSSTGITSGAVEITVYDSDFVGQTASITVASGEDIDGNKVTQLGLQIGDRSFVGRRIDPGEVVTFADGSTATVQSSSPYYFMDADGIVVATVANKGSAGFMTPLDNDAKSGAISGIQLDGNTITTTLLSSGSGSDRIDSGHALSGAMIGTQDDKLVFQIGANGSADQRVGLHVESMAAANLGTHIETEYNPSGTVADISVATREAANDAIKVIDAATNQVSGTRADLGALQNRLEHTINNLGVTRENLQSAESSIRDVDMAKEMMEFTKNNILVQASQSMLAQANQLPQGVLSLLR